MFRLLLRRLRGGGDGSAPDDATAADDAADGGDDTGDETDGADDEQYFWDLVPSWQYDGRHVESGGQTTKEQEEALRDIQRQAAAIEAREGTDAPEHSDEP